MEKFKTNQVSKKILNKHPSLKITVSKNRKKKTIDPKPKNIQKIDKKTCLMLSLNIFKKCTLAHNMGQCAFL